MPISSPPPPEPDLIAERGTDQWRDAVHAKQQWIAEQLTHGVGLDELVDAGYMDKYGEAGSPREGRLSHDYEKWQKALAGESMGDEGLPQELGAAQWDVGNFQRQVGVGDWTEWPPGSGHFFNDPANDSSKRQWRDQYGRAISAPEAGPEIDYSGLLPGETPGQYLKRHQAEQEAEAKAKPITAPGMGVSNFSRGPQNPPQGPQNPAPYPQPNANPNAPQQNSPYPQSSPTTPQGDANKRGAVMGQTNTGIPSKYDPAIAGYALGNNPKDPNQQMGMAAQRMRRPRTVGSGWYSTWS